MAIEGTAQEGEDHGGDRLRSHPVGHRRSGIRPVQLLRPNGYGVKERAAAGARACLTYDRANLLAGNLIAGPAVIEEVASVTLLGPNEAAEVNRFGQLVVDVQGT
jgi:N-methylhydantoinase A/oxoprolinase/acetone carboxylase beta subunit